MKKMNIDNIGEIAHKALGPLEKLVTQVEAYPN